VHSVKLVAVSASAASNVAEALLRQSESSHERAASLWCLGGLEHGLNARVTDVGSTLSRHCTNCSARRARSFPRFRAGTAAREQHCPSPQNSLSR